MNRRKSPRRGTREFELQNVKITIEGEQKEQIFMRNWLDLQKPTKIVKERREGCKNEEELSLPKIPYVDLGAEH